MKYLRYYENNKKDIDSFDEEDWNEVEPDGTFLSWLKINYPDESKWIEIKKIYCWNNNLNSLKGIENLINLQVLYCSNNNLNSLKGIENLRNLQYLICYNNNLNSLKGIENLTKLKKLYCYNNNIDSLNGIENLRNLKRLYCSNNNFSNEYINYIKSYCKEKNINLSV